MTKLKWAIKRTPENYKEVNHWYNRTFNYGYSSSEAFTPGWMHSQFVNSTYSHHNPVKVADFHEITIDEFRLLTDQERREKIISFGGNSATNEGWVYVDGCNITISLEVCNELQRMWKEREWQSELYNEVLAMDEEKENEEKFMTDWRIQTKLGIEAMNKVIKALDKQNKLLRKLIKKQNSKRNEKTIM